MEDATETMENDLGMQQNGLRNQDSIDQRLTAQTLSIVQQFLKEHTPRQLPLHWFNPHNRNQDFIGRLSILNQLEQNLSPNPENVGYLTGIRSFALCGLGDVGKTQVAVEFGYSQRHVYDLIFWIQADGPSKLMQSFSIMAEQLHLLDAQESGDQAVSRKAVLDWLAKASHVKWLLIFDNVDDPKTLRDFWPSEGSGAILMTSRDPYLKSQRYPNHASRKGCDLDSLSLADGSGLLRRLIDDGTSDSDNESSYEVLSAR